KLINTYDDVIYFEGNRFQINSFIKYENIKYVPSSIPYFREAQISSVLNIHMITIDGYMNGHKFVSECCKSSIFDFIRRGGLVGINGTYYDLNTKNNINFKFLSEFGYLKDYVED